jgi:precorrin-6Y C5,15-methyltransferase (decarboxylating)
MTIVPHPGAFSLAAARLGWSLADTETVTVHGRPLHLLNRTIQPGARLLIYSQDGDTPAQVAALLTARGFGASPITVIERLGSPRERRIDGIASAWVNEKCANLNTVAVECHAGPDALLLPPTPGLPDDAFESDGQLTKREARALTIAALAPLPGQVLWDVGAGSGSVAIEWLRAAPTYRIDDVAAMAFAIERDPHRCSNIARNAAALGTPLLEIVHGEAPEALRALRPPHSIFLGGGITAEGVVDTCWAALKPGGRFVANSVTIEAMGILCRLRERCGGTLTRIAVSRAEPVGNLTTFRPHMDVVQFVAVKV